MKGIHVVDQFSVTTEIRDQRVARLLTFAVLALPFRSELGGLPLRRLPPARMLYGRHACHLAFSSVLESRGGRPNSSSLPDIRFQQIPARAGRAHPRDRYSCVG